MNYKDAEEFLKKINKIYEQIIPHKEKTFMEVSGYPHYENVCSNILAFYLDPNEEHKLNDIVLKALIDAVNNKKQCELSDVFVTNLKIFREYTTEKGNRIDIVLISDELVIGIENKINASVYNDLEDYEKTLNKLNENAIKILLSLHDENKETLNNEFINITYKEFFAELKEKLKKVGNKNKWYIYLEDFIKNLEGFEVEVKVEKENNEWIKENKEQIKELLEILNFSNKNIENKQKEYISNLESMILKNDKIRIWSGDNFGQTSYIVFDVGCNLDAMLTVDGWKLGVYIWKKSNLNKIKTILKENNFNILEEVDNHEWLYEFDYDYPIEEIVKRASDIYEVIKSINN